MTQSSLPEFWLGRIRTVNELSDGIEEFLGHRSSRCDVTSLMSFDREGKESK